MSSLLPAVPLISHLISRLVNEERTLEVEIEPGVRDGMEYPFIGEGTIVAAAVLCSACASSLAILGSCLAVRILGHAVEDCFEQESATH